MKAIIEIEIEPVSGVTVYHDMRDIRLGVEEYRALTREIMLLREYRDIVQGHMDLGCNDLYKARKRVKWIIQKLKEYEGERNH